MKKNILGAVVVLVAFGALAYTYTHTFKKSATKTAEQMFVCKNGLAVNAVFYQGSDVKNSKVEITMIGTTSPITLPQTVSASGARYANADESIIFWNKGNTAQLERPLGGGERMVTSCVVENDVTDYKAIAYFVDRNEVRLNGESVVYFGNEVRGDFDGNNTEDIAFIFTTQSGGSGTFYYLGVAYGVGKGFFGTEAVLLGDRIAPQTTEFRDGKIIVNYADRKKTDSFATAPSVGVSKVFILDPLYLELGEVAQNFEGEADPARMKLDMKAWNWIKTQYNNDTTVEPKKKNVFAVTFDKDGRVSIATDCNRMGGTYTVTNNKIVFGPMMSTKMYCEGSQEGDFATMLENVSSFLFTSKGELVLELKLDSGQMIFR
jgi:heat shock protein HslJ/membrane-bound inhibitor of C-type lysozyme